MTNQPLVATRDANNLVTTLAGGYYNIPLDGRTYQIHVYFGTYASGNFTAIVMNPALDYIVPLPIPLLKGGSGTQPWNGVGKLIPNAPANLYIHAVLERTPLVGPGPPGQYLATDYLLP